MAKLKSVGTTGTGLVATDRDAELRRAQERAFDGVKRARSESGREFAMQRAVADLVDACERYIYEAAAGSV
jgi:hypothetical protein